MMKNINKLKVMFLMITTLILLAACETKTENSKLNTLEDTNGKLQTENEKPTATPTPTPRPEKLSIVFDDADYLTLDEEMDLNVLGDKYREETNIGIALITTIEAQYAESIDAFLDQYMEQYNLNNGRYNTVIIAVYDTNMMQFGYKIYTNKSVNDVEKKKYEDSATNAEKLACMFFNNYQDFKGWEGFIEEMYRPFSSYATDTNLTLEEKYKKGITESKYMYYSEDYYKTVLEDPTYFTPLTAERTEEVLVEAFYGEWVSEMTGEYLYVTDTMINECEYKIIGTANGDGLIVYFFYSYDTEHYHVLQFGSDGLGSGFSIDDEWYYSSEDYEQYQQLAEESNNSVDANGEELEPGDKVTYYSGATTYGGEVQSVEAGQCIVDWQIKKSDFEVRWSYINTSDNNVISSALFGAPQDDDMFYTNVLVKQAFDAW
jgi:hypothetical protein